MASAVTNKVCFIAQLYHDRWSSNGASKAPPQFCLKEPPTVNATWSHKQVNSYQSRSTRQEGNPQTRFRVHTARSKIHKAESQSKIHKVGFMRAREVCTKQTVVPDKCTFPLCLAKTSQVRCSCEEEQGCFLVGSLADLLCASLHSTPCAYRSGGGRSCSLSEGMLPFIGTIGSRFFPTFRCRWRWLLIWSTTSPMPDGLGMHCPQPLASLDVPGEMVRRCS